MLDRCIELASQLHNRKQRIASIITDKKGRILSFGVNSYSKSHPKMFYYAQKCGNINKIFLHSEMASIVACKSKPHAIYIARVDKNGNSLPCNPCPMCSMAIKDFGITEVITT